MRAFSPEFLSILFVQRTQQSQETGLEPLFYHCLRQLSGGIKTCLVAAIKNAGTKGESSARLIFVPNRTLEPACLQLKFP